MNDFIIKINLLCDILDVKEELLEKILIITENQETLLKQKEKTREVADMFRKMMDEKHLLIDKIISNDNMFDNVFSSIKDIFEEKSKVNEELIKNLQEKIRKVTDIDVKIRVQEHELNRIALVQQKAISSRVNNASVKYMLNEYKKNTNRNHEYWCDEDELHK